MASVASNCSTRGRRRIVGAVLLLGLACGSPSKKQPTRLAAATAAKRSVLERVPASTPYVWAQLDPLPDDYLDALFANADGYRQVFVELRRVREKHPDILEDLDPQTRMALAIVGELDGKLSRRGLRELGLDVGGRIIVYGQGIWPVVRLEIADGSKLRKTIERLAARLEAEIPTMRHGEHQLWHAGKLLDGANIDIVLSVSDNELVAALTPAGRDQGAFLDALFADRPKGRSLAESGTLAQLAQRYKLGGGSAGFVDLVRVAELSAALIPDAEPACASELGSLASITPRWVFGTRELSRKAISGRVVVETSDELREALERSRAAVPALSLEIARRHSFALGVGLDVRSFAEYATAGLARLKERHFACRPLQDIAPMAKRLERSLAELLGSPARYLLGGQFLISHIEMTTGLPTDLAAAIFLGSGEPAQVVTLLAQFVPSLRGKTVEPGSPPIPLAVPGANALPFFRDVYIAAGQRGVAISVGDKAKKLLGHVNREPAGGMPLFVMHSTGEFWRTITRLTDSSLADAMSEFDAELAKAMQKVEEDNYESFSFDARVMSEGVRVDVNITYPEAR